MCDKVLYRNKAEYIKIKYFVNFETLKSIRSVQLLFRKSFK